LGDIKEDWGSGGLKSSSGVQGQSPGRGLENEVPQKLKIFCETTHNICIKIQQTVVAVTGKINPQILVDITMDVPLHKYWIDMCPPCPIGIDAPAEQYCNR